MNLRLELGDHGIRSDPGQVAVWIFRLEISGIEIDAEPGALDRLDEAENLLGRRGNAAVILKGQEDAVFAGVFAGFLDRGDRLFVLFLILAFLDGAGENTDCLAAKPRSVFDPLLHIFELFL